MRKTVVLSALACLIATPLALWPSPTHSASKGRAASPPSGKTAVSPGDKGAVTKKLQFRVRDKEKQDYMEYKFQDVFTSKRKPKDFPVTKRHEKPSHRLW